MDARLRRENEVADRQACRFLDPGTGIVQEQQESAVAQRGVACRRQACDQCLNLIALQELGRIEEAAAAYRRAVELQPG